MKVQQVPFPHTKHTSPYSSVYLKDFSLNSGRGALCSFINMLPPSDRFPHESEAL